MPRWLHWPGRGDMAPTREDWRRESGWYETRSDELAPFESGQGWPGDRGRLLGSVDDEFAMGAPPAVVPAATCGACGDYRCLGDAAGNGCMNATAWQTDPRFMVGPDGPADVAGMGWNPLGVPEVGLWAQDGDRLFWLDAHPSGYCRTGDPNCQGGCGG